MAGQGGARVEDGVARQGGPVAFGIFAAQELAAAPMVAHGRCEAAGCGAAFDRKRTSQKFCGASCERATVAEFRRWGHRMAPALLVWRVGKYERHDNLIQQRTRAARRFISACQSAWVAERGAKWDS
jgi:hypothetical protein